MKPNLTLDPWDWINVKIVTWLVWVNLSDSKIHVNRYVDISALEQERVAVDRNFD